MTDILSIDFETRSTIDLAKTGVYPYAAHPSTDIWVMAYAFNDEEPEVWLPSEPKQLHWEVESHILKGREVHAWNANFERTIWRNIMVPRYGWPEVPLEQWFCSQANGAAYGIPNKL